MYDKVYLFGDSIGKGVVFNTERQRYCLAKRRCTNVLKDAGLEIEDHAVMGATVMDGYEDFCQTMTEPGSVCVIEYGGNDCDLDWADVAEHPDVFHDGKVPLPVFREMLGMFIREARKRGLKPLLTVPTPLHAKRYFSWVTKKADPAQVARYLGDIEHIYRWQEQYAQAVRDVADAEACPLVDLREVLLEQRNFPDMMCVDGIHPNEKAQELLGQALLLNLPEYQSMLRKTA